MKLFKGYKGVAIIYIILTVLNIIWLVGYDNNTTTKQVSNEKSIVLNA